MNIDSETTIAILKATGAVAGGILGIAGLLSDFKEKSGRLTRAGRAVLIGIVISAAIGVSDTIFEAYKAKSDSKSRAEHAEHLLHEISRNLQPITKLSASYWIEIPPGNRIVDNYIARLNKGIEERVGSLSGLPHKLRGDGISASALENEGEPLSIEVTSKSDLWPKGEEAFIGNLASQFSLSISILKKPVEVESFMSRSNGLSATSVVPSRAELSWHRKTKRLFILATSDFDKSIWESDGSIVSVLDLYGAQLMLFTPNAWEVIKMPLLEKFRDHNKDMLAGSLRIKIIFLSFGEGREMRLGGRQFKKTKYGFGYPVFSLVFPKNDNDFETFTSYSGADDD